MSSVFSLSIAGNTGEGFQLPSQENKANRDELASGAGGDPKTANAQASLVQMNYNLGDYGKNKNGVDGDSGPKTQAATKQFQAAVGLPPTGKLDDSTMVALDVAVAAGMTKEDISKLGEALGLRYEYGYPVLDFGELQGLSEVDLVARTIYGEAGRGENGKEAVAWTIKNRVDAGKGNYNQVVLAKLQYCGLSGEKYGTRMPSWTPLTQSGKWKRSLEIAKDIVNNNGENTNNPIGKGMYFRAGLMFKNPDRFRVLENGQEQLFADKKWNNIRDRKPFGGNMFFNYGTIN